MINYPIKFHPILKDKIWGGDKLKSLLNKKSDAKSLGESWEISGVEDNISIVSNGVYINQSLVDLIKNYKGAFLGQKIYDKFGERFPLLIKFIDAKYDLSVQLHPNDELAQERHNSFGKSEMWHIVQADKNSKLIIGFNTIVDKRIYCEAIEKENIVSLLNFVKVGKRDSFFINSGTVHAIGGGVLLAEIQQTSDITYRVFDWKRKGFNGKKESFTRV
jgi:mannose-6-phosphate isomerase